MSVVICKLPKAGLGNQLFPLMHAQLFARLNGLPVIVTGYHQLKLGPYLRKEKSKRRYSGYFNFQKNVIGEYVDQLRIIFLKKKYTAVYEPEVRKLKEDELSNRAFIFEKLPTYHHYFKQYKDHREAVKQLLYGMLNPWITREVENAMAPVIGVHIRMGDFRKLNEGEVFKGGHVRTPEHYFIDIINTIREVNGKDLPVSVFTDGYPDEFKALLNIGNIKIVEGNTDIVDLLLLSKSSVIVSSTGSTFSYWAGFLSEAPIIMHPDHIHESIRNNEGLFEGPISTYRIKGIALKK